MMSAMKHKGLVTMVWMLFFLGCSHSELEEVVMEKQDVQYLVNAGISKDFSVERENDLQLKLFKVSDNRCPTHSVCIQRGFAELSFMVSNEKDTTFLEYTFYPTNKKVRPEAFSLSQKKYELIVFDVLPYLSINQKIDLKDYVVYANVLRLD